MGTDSGCSDPEDSKAVSRLVALLNLPPQFVQQLAAAQRFIPELKPALHAVRRGVADAAEARLELGRGFREAGDVALEADGGSLSEPAARTAVSRYYYSMHHLLRAACLVAQDSDPGRDGAGHAPTIRAAAELARDDRAFLAKLRRVVEVGALIAELDPGDTGFRKRLGEVVEDYLGGMHEIRKRADYDPAGTDDPLLPPVDFVLEAGRLRQVAHSMWEHLGAYIQTRCTERRAGE